MHSKELGPFKWSHILVIETLFFKKKKVAWKQSHGRCTNAGKLMGCSYIFVDYKVFASWHFYQCLQHIDVCSFQSWNTWKLLSSGCCNPSSAGWHYPQSCWFRGRHIFGRQENQGPALSPFINKLDSGVGWTTQPIRKLRSWFSLIVEKISIWLYQMRCPSHQKMSG